MAFAVTVAPVTSINAGNPGTSVSLSLAGCTAGNAVIFGVYWDKAPPVAITSVTLTGESNGTLIGTAVYNGGSANGDAQIQLGYFQNLSGSGSKTLTVNFSASFSGVGLWAMEVSGGSTSALLDANANAHKEQTGTSAAPSTTLTTSSSNDLIVGMVMGGTGTDPAAGSGYTLVSISQYGQRNAGEYKLDAGAAGSVVVDFTIGSSDTYGLVAAAFAQAGGGAVKRNNLGLMGCGR